MADYTDLLQDVSYHSSRNLYVPRLQQTICEYFLCCRWIPPPVIENLLLCFMVKSILERFAVILLYTETNS